MRFTLNLTLNMVAPTRSKVVGWALIFQDCLPCEVRFQHGDVSDEFAKGLIVERGALVNLHFPNGKPQPGYVTGEIVLEEVNNEP